jgi:hypothetical protein
VPPRGYPLSSVHALQVTHPPLFLPPQEPERWCHHEAVIALAHLELRKGNQQRALSILKEAQREVVPDQAAIFNAWAAIESKAVSLRRIALG